MGKFKLVSVLLASSLILTACGDDSSSSSETTTTMEQSKPKFEEKHRQEFIKYMEEKLAKRAEEQGTTALLSEFRITFSNEGNIIVIIPQDFKYLEKSSLLSLSDTMYYFIEDNYKEFGKEKGLDVTNSPRIGVGTTRGELIATEKSSGGMELKID